MDAWQRRIDDVGAKGRDKGNGSKSLSFKIDSNIVVYQINFAGLLTGQNKNHGE